MYVEIREDREGSSRVMVSGGAWNGQLRGYKLWLDSCENPCLCVCMCVV